MNVQSDLDSRQVTVTVNGKQESLEVEGRTTLADMLRQEFHTQGVRVGCEHGVCGSCTILFDGEPMRACLLLAVQADGHEIKTIESMADGNKLHEIQRHSARNMVCSVVSVRLELSFRFRNCWSVALNLPTSRYMKSWVDTCADARGINRFCNLYALPLICSWKSK